MTGSGTKARAVRGVTDDKWKRFGQAAEAAGIDRSKALRDFIDYFIGDVSEPLERPGT